MHQLLKYAKKCFIFLQSEIFSIIQVFREKNILIKIFNTNVQLDKIDTSRSNHKLKNIEGKIQVNINFKVDEMDWKIIGISALINAVITSVLSFIFFPLAFLGPIIGGFLSSYPSEGFEDYERMDEKDGAVVGAISGLIGGLIIALILVLGFGNISAIGLKIGLDNVITTGYVVLQLSIVISLVLSLIGGVIGVVIKR